MRDRDPVEHEQLFFQRLEELVPGMHDWYHRDDDGTLWMIASFDFVEDHVIRATLRIDFDGSHLKGGWSPAGLNWDDGVRAEDASIDVHGPDGLTVAHLENPQQAADLAAVWFRDHIERRPGQPEPARMPFWKRASVAGLRRRRKTRRM